MTELDLVALDDAALSRVISETEDAVNARTNLVRLRAEQERREKEAAARAAERELLIAKLTAFVDDRRTRAVGVLGLLDITAPVEQGPHVREGAMFFLQWYALGSSLAGVFGERFRGRWDGLEQLELHAPQATRALCAANGGRLPRLTAEQQPWKEDLERLRELVGPRVTAFGNGG